MSYARKKTEDIPGTKAHQIYRLKDGRQVPGGSTIAKIAGAHQSETALIRWANRLGLDGYDSTKYRDKLADVGTLTHSMCLEFFRSGDYRELWDHYPKWVVVEAKKCFVHFENWAKGKRLEPLLMEEPLVSEIYLFGGTPDWFGKVDGKAKLLDYKTSKSVYPSHFYQLAGYNTLLFENEFESEEIEVLRIGRNEKEGFSNPKKTAKEILLQWEIFRKALELYWLQNKEPKYFN